jgi:hypothetical protein
MYIARALTVHTFARPYALAIVTVRLAIAHQAYALPVALITGNIAFLTRVKGL